MRGEEKGINKAADHLEKGGGGGGEACRTASAAGIQSYQRRQSGADEAVRDYCLLEESVLATALHSRVTLGSRWRGKGRQMVSDCISAELLQELLEKRCFCGRTGL